MNIASVNTSANSAVNDKESAQNAPVWKKGQILEGKITKVSSQVSINFSDREVKVSPSTVCNAREGEIRKFEIMEVSKESIVLKEVGSNTLDSGTIQMVITQVDTGQAVFSDQLNQAAKEKKKEEQVKESQEHLEHSSNRITEEDYKDITDANISIEEYTAAQLDMALERVKEQRAYDESMLEQQVEKQTEGREQVEQIAESKSNSGLSKEISERLKKANIPATEENIKKLMEALNLSQSASQMKPESYRYLIENQMPASAENIYKATFIGKISEKKEISDDVWKELRSQAETVIIQSGEEVTEASLQNAKWILDNQIPLTKESLNRLTALQDMTEHIPPEQVMERIIEGMRSGQDPRKVNLEAGTEEIAKNFIEDLKTISDEAVVEAVKTASDTGGDVTVKGLKDAQEKITVRRSDKIENYLQNIVDSDISVVKAKRQLEEVRLKMTADTAVRLIGKGINLDIASLDKLVGELRETENSYYKSLLKGVTPEEVESSISVFRETKDFLQDLKTFPSYILGTTLSQAKTETIRELHTEGSKLKANLDKASTAYDTLKTEPRRDLGDSIKKAFQSIDGILEDIGMETSQANRRAVKILGYNRMEITEQSISQVKAYDAEVNELMENLHPAVALQLIKDGINPLDTPIVELNEQVSNMKEEMKLSDNEKYSKFLWKMQKESAVSDEERKAFIGIYRLLNNVEKTDGAAIGSLIQTEQEVTLNNLLRAVKIMKSGGIDQVIDDKFGQLESLTFQTEPISEQLAGAFKKNSSDSKSGQEGLAYQQKLLENIMDSISPIKLKSLGGKEGIMDHSLEWLKEQFSVEVEDKTEDAYAKEQVESLKELTLNSEASLRFLNDFEMPDTIGNIIRANQFMSSTGNAIKSLGLKLKGITDEDAKEEVKEAINGFMESLTDQETMLEQYEKLDQTVKHILKNEYGNNQLTAKDLADLKNLTKGITFTKNMARKECYQIPLAVGDSITNIHLTVVHNGESKGKLNVSVDSDQLGHITGDFQVIDGKIKGSVLGDSQKGIDQMKPGIYNFEQECRASGLSLGQIQLQAVRGTQSSYINQKRDKVKQQDEVNTKQLYEVAKAFVRFIKQAEE